MPRVIRIEPTVDIRTHTSISNIKKRRVCAYARVSTNSDEQETSYEAQVDYYRKYIQAHNEWEYVGIYADEGVTGTSTKRRNGFKEMMKDALDHKIDLILAKSVSRFARNTVDTLTNIRMLKDNGVMLVAEVSNMGCTAEAIDLFIENRMVYAPGKAVNAGGVATSGLEMTQNAQHIYWTAEEVDQKLHQIMSDIYDQCCQYGLEPDGYMNYMKGANIAGFMKVAHAMMGQGII